MPRFERFTFLLDHQERADITYLAGKLKRSQSDAIRFVIFQAAAKFKRDDELAARLRWGKDSPNPPIEPGVHR